MNKLNQKQLIIKYLYCLCITDIYHDNHPSYSQIWDLICKESWEDLTQQSRDIVSECIPVVRKEANLPKMMDRIILLSAIDNHNGSGAIEDIKAFLEGEEK